MRIEKVAKLTLSVPGLVQTVNTKLSENSDNLKELREGISLNKDSIGELKDSVKHLCERKTELPVNHLHRVQTSGNGLSIKDIMANQARFSTAVQLGNSPTMFFAGELHKYVQFVTMFQNSFNETINDSVTLHNILMRHVRGPAKNLLNHVFSVHPPLIITIRQCRF